MAYLSELTYGEAVEFDNPRSFTSSGGGTRYLIPDDRELLTESSELPPPIWQSAPGFASEEELESEHIAELAKEKLPSTIG